MTFKKLKSRLFSSKSIYLIKIGLQKLHKQFKNKLLFVSLVLVNSMSNKHILNKADIFNSNFFMAHKY